MSSLRIVLIFLCIQAVDAWTTVLGINSGRFQESNGFFADAVQTGHLGWFFAKMIVAVAVVVIAYLGFQRVRTRFVLVSVLSTIAVIAPISNALQLWSNHV